jgi:hypothetical protein
VFQAGSSPPTLSCALIYHVTNIVRLRAVCTNLHVDQRQCTHTRSLDDGERQVDTSTVSTTTA